MKYPIGIQTFEKIREGGYIYVDKTDLVHNPFTRRYRLDFPNNEVKRGFVTMIASSYLKPREETGTIDDWLVEGQ